MAARRARDSSSTRISKDVPDIFRRQPRHPGAVVVVERDQPLGFQLTQRLAHRNPADAILSGQFALIQALA